MAREIATTRAATPLPAKLCLDFLKQLNARQCHQDEHPFPVNLCSSANSSIKLPVLLGSQNRNSVHFASFDDSPFLTPTKEGNFERCVSGLSTDCSTTIESDDPEDSNSSGSWRLGVKNTFVHVSDSSDDELPVSRSKSEAPRSSLQTPASQIPSCKELPASLPKSGSKLPSVGSALHASGSCKPCAWFYKPEGCANGDQCRHCHVCSIEERRRRRKTRVLTRRRRGSSSSLDESPLAPALTTEGLERSGFSNERSLSMTSEDLDVLHLTVHWKIDVKNTFVHMSDNSDEELDFTRCKTEPTRAALMSPALQIQSCTDVCTSMPESVPHLPSIGSALHGSGSCKPCAWFWKREGCANGADCHHCHLCSQEEIKRRRKVVQSARRRKGSH